MSKQSEFSKFMFSRVRLSNIYSSSKKQIEVYMYLVFAFSDNYHKALSFGCLFILIHSFSSMLLSLYLKSLLQVMRVTEFAV
jgi:hypothetical protein